MEAGRLAGALFPATRADTAAGRERGTELLITEEERGEVKEVEYPVPILGANDGVVNVVVVSELDAPREAPLKDKFSCCSLC